MTVFTARSEKDRVSEVMKRITDAWLNKRPEEMSRLLHEGIVMVHPGFSERAVGLTTVVASFKDFCENAVVHQWNQADPQLDVIGTVAVVSFAFEMVFERASQRRRSTGRDFWVFEKRKGEWIAVFRTMLDLKDEPLSPG